MKKICIITLLVLIIVPIFSIFAISDHYPTSGGEIVYDDTLNTLTINDPSPNTPTILTTVEADGYAIYSNDDLIIDLKRDTLIDSTNGIYCDGDLTIKGSYNLNIDYDEIGINCTGELTIDGATINLVNTNLSCSGDEMAYHGPAIQNSPYIIDNDTYDIVTGFTEPAYYDDSSETYKRYEYLVTDTEIYSGVSITS